MKIEIALNLLVFFGGLLLGNRLAIGNERRKEFNEAAKPIYQSLEEQRRSLAEGEFPHQYLNANSFIQIERQIGFLRRDAFKAEIARYEAAIRECGGYDMYGRFELKNPRILIDAILKLQAYLPHK